MSNLSEIYAWSKTMLAFAILVYCSKMAESYLVIPFGDDGLEKPKADLKQKLDVMTFSREAKSENSPRLMAIDLSALSQSSSSPGGGFQLHHNHRPVPKLLGVDVSVLSNNPEPSLPIVPAYDDPVLQNVVDVPSQYDRYPPLMRYENEVDEAYNMIPYPDTNNNRLVPAMPNAESNELVLLPFLDYPFRTMRAYRRVLSEHKKRDMDISVADLLRQKPRNEEQRKFMMKLVLGMLDSFAHGRSQTMIKRKGFRTLGSFYPTLAELYKRKRNPSVKTVNRDGMD